MEVLRSWTELRTLNMQTLPTYVADQNTWIAYTTQTRSLIEFTGKSVIKKCFNIHDDNGISSIKNYLTLKVFKKFDHT